jgi:uncharacterized phage-like protein YoqJ
MTENLNLNILKTACVTGHRKLKLDFNANLLEEKLVEIIKSGYRNFLIGMAVGFDSACFKILKKLREIYNLKLIACIPCENQEKNFSEKEKIEYFEMLLDADQKIYLSKEYKKNCMNLRNFFMVDNSSLVIAYLKEQKGGTFNTVNYAKRKGKEIVYV